MSTMLSRIGCAVATGALVLTSLVGCGGAQSTPAEPAPDPEPTTAMELLERYNEQENKDNCHMDLNMDAKVTSGEFELPMGVSMSLDRAGDAAHGTTSIAFGESVTSEMYLVKEEGKWAQYAQSPMDENSWTRTEVESSATTESLINEKLFKDAEFAKTDDGYTVTVSGDKIGDVLSTLGSNDYSDMLGSDESDVSKALKEASIVYTFGKDFLVKSVAYDMNYNYQSGDENALLSLSANSSISLKVTVSGYGTIDPSKVALPDEVKKSAQDSGESFNLEDLDSLTEEVGFNETAI